MGLRKKRDDNPHSRVSPGQNADLPDARPRPKPNHLMCREDEDQKTLYPELPEVIHTYSYQKVSTAESGYIQLTDTIDNHSYQKNVHHEQHE